MHSRPVEDAHLPLDCRQTTPPPPFPRYPFPFPTDNRRPTLLRLFLNAALQGDEDCTTLYAGERLPFNVCRKWRSSNCCDVIVLSDALSSVEIVKERESL